MVVVLPSSGFTQSEQVIFGSVPYKFSKLSNNVCHQHADGKKEQKIRHSWNTAFDVHSMKQNSILNWKKHTHTHTHTLNILYVIFLRYPRITAISVASGHTTPVDIDHEIICIAILPVPVPLIQERQLSVTGESMPSQYWLTAYEV